VKVPLEDAAATFALTSEAAAYNASNPTFAEKSLVIYKFTMENKISEEIANDQAANLDSWLAEHIGRRWGVTENVYTIAGTGSSQPEGILTGGTAAFTLAGTNAVAAGEIPRLYHSLAAEYHPGVWTMRQSTFAKLQGLTGNQYVLVTPPQMGEGTNWRLWGAPVFLSQSMGATSTATKGIAFANWNYYGLAENQGLTVTRNPYIYESTGFVAIYSRVRWGGGVLQASAVQYGTFA
jgi:HK97 family phage major capsid protein